MRFQSFAFSVSAQVNRERSPFRTLFGGFRKLPILLVAVSAFSAPSAQVAEPEYSGTVLYIAGPDLALKTLETQTASTRLKTKALGLAGGSGVIWYRGSASPIRFQKGKRLEFVVRLDTGGLDPALTVNLDALQSAKKTREATMVKVGSLGMGAKNTANDATVQLVFSKYGEHSVKFSPSVDLPPGEYVITTKASGRTGYLFGID